MNKSKLNLFNQEVSATYRGECYLVRNYGAIYRQQRPNKRKRPLDEQWTFGTLNRSDGYRKICGIQVHRIVATAFHGEQPTPKHVVDHIDTNRLNNRPENLRWVTRLENLLDNPKTLSFIVKKWGSIEELLNDTNAAEKTDPITNRPWMRDALIQKALEDEYTKESLTPLAMQRDWRVPSEFPMCPNEISDSPLQDYASYLDTDAVFSRNQYWESIVETAEIDNDGNCLCVLCRISSGVKNYALAKVTIEDGKFIHTNKHTFFQYEGVEKSFCELVGKPWVEPEGYEGCIDDYC